MFGLSSLIRFIDWWIASAEPVYQCELSRYCAGTGVTLTLLAARPR